MNRGIRGTLVDMTLILAVALTAACSRTDPIQEQWESRDRLPSCGTLVRHLLSDVDAGSDPTVRCLRDALESGGAGEMVLEEFTTEGDPITSYLRVLEDGTSEVFTDARQDAFRSDDWYHATCDPPDAVLTLRC